jgi:undecaprenyl diphosphate synthase
VTAVDDGTADRATAAGLDPQRLPRHVGIIMDGNGRWARSKGWERVLGHQNGSESVRLVTIEGVRLGIRRLTLYAFSSENWSRPKPEVDFLMHLLVEFLRAQEPTLHEHGVRLEAIGRLDRLPPEVRAEIERVRVATSGHRRMVLCLALSYGGRDEIVDACRRIAEQAVAGQLPIEAIDAAAVQANLYAPEAGDCDVVIRTAGELRLSNFLPWQSVYAEYISSPVLWPDFGVAEFHACLREYQRRERRFGMV